MNVHSMRQPVPPFAASLASAAQASKSHSARSAAPAEQPDKRETILDAALDLFVEYGFHGTAVPQIAERAKVGAGTIYRYFPSKEALVNELYRAWKARLAAAFLTGFPADAPAREQFHHFWCRATAFALEHPRALEFLELHHHGSYLDAQSRQIADIVLEPAMEFFREATRRQITKPLEPWLLASIVWGSFVGMMRAGWEGKLRIDDEVLDQAEGCCWEAIRR